MMLYLKKNLFLVLAIPVAASCHMAQEKLLL